MKPDKRKICQVCCKTEQSAKPIRKKKKKKKSYGILGRIHVDLCGPLPNIGINGEKYFMPCVDEETRYCETYLLKRKSEAIIYFKKYKRKVENITGKKVKIVKTDGGGEFGSKEFEEFLENDGAVQIITNPADHAENGIVERMNRTLLKKARAMLFHFNLDIRLCSIVPKLCEKRALL